MESTTVPGDIVYLTVFGQPILLLGSYRAAHELLEKRSANYSDRPQSMMVKLWVFCLFANIFRAQCSLSLLQDRPRRYIRPAELW